MSSAIQAGPLIGAPNHVIGLLIIAQSMLLTLGGFATSWPVRHDA